MGMLIEFKDEEAYSWYIAKLKSFNFTINEKTTYKNTLWLPHLTKINYNNTSIELKSYETSKEIYICLKDIKEFKVS